MNYTHRLRAAGEEIDEAKAALEQHDDKLEQLVIRADLLRANVTALQCLVDVLVVRCALASPAPEVLLDDVAESATYQLRSMKLAGLSPDRQGLVREAAADCIAAKMAELRRMFVAINPNQAIGISDGMSINDPIGHNCNEAAARPCAEHSNWSPFRHDRAETSAGNERPRVGRHLDHVNRQSFAAAVVAREDAETKAYLARHFPAEGTDTPDDKTDERTEQEKQLAAAVAAEAEAFLSRQ